MSSTRKAGTAQGTDKTPAHGSDNPAPEAGMSRDIVNIGLNIFQDGIKGYTETQKDYLQWLWGYIHDDLNGSKSELEKAVSYDYSIILAIFNGRYDQPIDAFCEAIAKLKRKIQASFKLVSTPVTQRIIEAMDYCRDTGSMVTIKGPTGRSKTSTAVWWAKANNHGRSRYIRIPSGCNRRTIVVALAKSCGIGTNGKKTPDLESRLLKTFNARNTIIVDEAGHLMPRAGSSTSAIEFLRDLNDMCGCGVTLIFTDVYLDEMKNGRLAAYFEQFIGRIKFELTIPNDVMRSEVAAVVGNFRADAPEKLLNLAFQLASARDGKLRTLFEDLQRAKSWSQANGQELDAKALKMAADWRKSGGVWETE